ncbi:hypothetical protein [Streptomyces sp. NPDC006132]|uniref:hypothetical protein n=1 Tax=Streptomyces sp. NPDC006132 TaxID=3156732 RepID=UPI0033CE49D2
MTGLLGEIVDHYLGSGDFNGYFFHEEPEDARRAAVGLLDDGLIEVVGEADYPNPHIRPWPTRRPVEQQRDDINNSGAEHGAICLYPTAKALEGRLDAQLHHDEPYRRRRAEGRGTLEVAYFRFDVLESYRNDPRFHFDFDDFGVRISVSDEVYWTRTKIRMTRPRSITSASPTTRRPLGGTAGNPSRAASAPSWVTCPS